MSLPPKYDLELRKRLNMFESKNAPKHPPVIYAIMFGVVGMVIIGATFSLNGIYKWGYCFFYSNSEWKKYYG